MRVARRVASRDSNDESEKQQRRTKMKRGNSNENK